MCRTLIFSPSLSKRFDHLSIRAYNYKLTF